MSDRLTSEEYAALSTAIQALEDYVRDLATRITKLEEAAKHG